MTTCRLRGYEGSENRRVLKLNFGEGGGSSLLGIVVYEQIPYVITLIVQTPQNTEKCPLATDFVARGQPRYPR
jgi:hypothetical protein